MLDEAERAAALALGRKRPVLFENITRDIYKAWLTHGDVAFDCGASKGLHVRQLAHFVGREGRVWAIEAVPQLVAEMQATLPPEIVRRTNFVCAALSDTRGLAEFYFLPEVPGWSSLFETHRPAGRKVTPKAFTVPTVTLDEFTDRVPSCAFMKIDIECAELLALAGGTAFLKRHRPLMVIEFSGPNAATRSGFSRDRVFALFAQIGYRLTDIFGAPYTPDRWGDPSVPVYSIAAPHAMVERVDALPLAEMVRNNVEKVSARLAQQEAS